MQQDIENQLGNNNFNNCMYNPAILTPLQYGMYFVIIGAAYLLPLSITGKRMEMYPEMWRRYPWLITLRNVPTSITSGLIVPIIFYVKNQRARSYIKREFWDWAPDCIQLYNPYQPKINIIMKSKFDVKDVIDRPEETNKVFEESNPDGVEVEVVAHSVAAKDDFVSTHFFK